MQHILFVGDSFTHGRYTPVRPYHSGGAAASSSASTLVVDENYGQTGARAELEPGPWGGIPAIFAQLAAEAGLRYDVHIEAISQTSLSKNFAAASGVIAQPGWNAVVLQELSIKPLPSALTGSGASNPRDFCASVQTIERAVHGAAPHANVYLYEPWARADLAQALAGNTGAAGFAAQYQSALGALSDANHDAYYTAAAMDGAIAGVAPVGEAWRLAWNQGVANPDPFVSSGLPLLWYGFNAVNDPQISSPDYLHPGVDGAYLAGLVLFAQITGTDVTRFGGNETAAQQLGVPATLAARLQQIAAQAVKQASAAPLNASAPAPCTQSQ
ncbi:hypothetical protein [Burkholderia gladioli]|uniref:hypothetical protein n=1 Tax=Burkholderia gladioli TaxID=28095 RepID=UPI0019032543|nr:hypothetical protein [Burkholderia gladioli]MBJ9712430.1 hypothetical protein [Burkholderia gladioli]